MSRNRPGAGPWRYLIALGSNRCHSRHGRPEGVLRAVPAALAEQGLTVLAMAPLIASAPLGPSRRRYANGAMVVATALAPPALLVLLKDMERAFGRRRARRWGARVLDLDVVLWSGGHWQDKVLTIPHPAFRTRRFVLDPACAIAPDWRDPVTGLALPVLRARLTRPRPVPRAARP